MPVIGLRALRNGKRCIWSARGVIWRVVEEAFQIQRRWTEPRQASMAIVSKLELTRLRMEGGWGGQAARAKRQGERREVMENWVNGAKRTD